MAEWKEEESGEDEEDEDEEEGWRLVPKGIGECERAGAVRSMGGEEGGGEKGRGSEGGVRTHRSAVLEKWSESEKPA